MHAVIIISINQISVCVDVLPNRSCIVLSFHFSKLFYCEFIPVLIHEFRNLTNLDILFFFFVKLSPDVS